MSSQKYAKLKERSIAVNEETEGAGEQKEQYWYCTVQFGECFNTSFHNGKPRCENCAVAKDFKSFSKHKPGKEADNPIMNMKMSDIFGEKPKKRKVKVVRKEDNDDEA